jgi:hypothetical protein
MQAIVRAYAKRDLVELRQLAEPASVKLGDKDFAAFLDMWHEVSAEHYLAVNAEEIGRAHV